VRPLVLIADGHDDTRELYAVALASFGFETIAVADGADAFARAWEVRPDIIVTEIAFGGHDGWTLFADLKGDPRTRNIPLVVLTGRAETSVRARASRAGCAAVLIKPYLPEELAHALRELLGAESIHAASSVRR
jgi:CheY-like chemotaxis protein